VAASGASSKNPHKRAIARISTQPANSSSASDRPLPRQRVRSPEGVSFQVSRAAPNNPVLRPITLYTRWDRWGRLRSTALRARRARSASGGLRWVLGSYPGSAEREHKGLHAWIEKLDLDLPLLNAPPLPVEPLARAVESSQLTAIIQTKNDIRAAASGDQAALERLWQRWEHILNSPDMREVAPDDARLLRRRPGAHPGCDGEVVASIAWSACSRGCWFHSDRNRPAGIAQVAPVTSGRARRARP
jgi:hypothetical protein